MLVKKEYYTYHNLDLTAPFLLSRSPWNTVGSLWNRNGSGNGNGNADVTEQKY